GRRRLCVASGKVGSRDERGEEHGQHGARHGSSHRRVSGGGRVGLDGRYGNNRTHVSEIVCRMPPVFGSDAQMTSAIATTNHVTALCDRRSGGEAEKSR